MTTESSGLKYLPAFIRTRLEGHTNFLKVAGNAGWLTAEKVLNLFLGLVVGAWVARYLGPEQFGLLNYAIAFAALFTPLATLGLDQVVVRDIVQNPTEADDILGTAFLLKILGSIVAIFGITGILVWLQRDETTTRWLVVIISLGMLFQSFDVIDFWFQSQVQSKYVAVSRSVALVLTSIIKIVLILLHVSVLAFAVVQTIQLGLIVVCLVVVYSIQGSRLTAWNVNLTQARKLLRDSWPLILSSMAIMIYMKIDQVMLKHMVGDKATGIYAAAVRLSEMWYFIPMAISASVLPAIVEAKKVGEELYYQRMQKLFDGMTALAFAIIIMVIPVSGFVITTLYGHEYNQSIAILNIHIFASLFVFLGVAQGSWNVTEGLIFLDFKRKMGGCVINVLLNIVLIPKYGGIGAAIATVISQAAASCFLNLFHVKTRKIFFMQVKSIFFVRRIIK